MRLRLLGWGHTAPLGGQTGHRASARGRREHRLRGTVWEGAHSLGAARGDQKSQGIVPSPSPQGLQGDPGPLTASLKPMKLLSHLTSRAAEEALWCLKSPYVCLLGAVAQGPGQRCWEGRGSRQAVSSLMASHTHTGRPSHTEGRVPPSPVHSQGC